MHYWVKNLCFELTLDFCLIYTNRKADLENRNLDLKKTTNLILNGELD